MSRQKAYDCSICKKKLFDQRACYFFKPQEQEITFVQDVVNDDGNVIFKKDKKKDMVDVEEIVDEIIPDIMDCYKETSAFKACLKTNICPKSLMTDEVSEVINMESFCKDYHLQPLGKDVGYLDYPRILVELFGIIGTTRDRVNLETLQEAQE